MQYNLDSLTGCILVSFLVYSIAIFVKYISDIISVSSEIICNTYMVLDLYCSLTYDNLKQEKREIYYDLLFIYELL